MRQRSKYVISWLVVTCLLVGLSLTMSGGAAFGKKVTLSFWQPLAGFEAQPIRDCVEAFNAKYPDIKIDESSVPSIVTKLLTGYAAGNPPELYAGWGIDTFDIGLRGVFRPLEDLAEAKGLDLRKLIMPQYLLQCVFRGHVYQIPEHGCLYGMYYNKRLLKEAGIEEPPKTIEELTLYNQKLTKFDSEGNIIQMGFHFDDTGNTWTNNLFAHVFGGTIFNLGKERYEFDDGALEAWTWAQDIVKQVGSDKYVKFAAGFGDWGTPGTAFLSERTAMLHQGPWMQEHIRRFNPDLDYGWIPWPVADAMFDQLYPLASAPIDSIAIPEKSDHPEEAFEFLAWFASWEGRVTYHKGPYGYGAAVLNPYTSVTDEKFWEEVGIEHPYTKSAMYPQMMTGNLFASDYYIEHSLWSKFGGRYQELVRMQATPREALTALVDEMNEILERYVK